VSRKSGQGRPARLALNGLPLDALAERLNTTRGALYQTLHDARRKLRSGLGQKRFTVDSI
jgi:RNA polymerase sigma-70 factor, ECF subfamily